MNSSTTRRTLAGLAFAAAAALVAASPAVADVNRSTGDLMTYGAAIPADADARVTSVETAEGRTIVDLHVWGLAPNTKYGAHAHVNPCSPADPAAAGGHFQFVKGGASDPLFANPRNEIWLDLTTNSAGNGHAKAVVNWQFTPGDRAKSVIIHERHTHHGPDNAGTAGARLACLDMAF